MIEPLLDLFGKRNLLGAPASIQYPSPRHLRDLNLRNVQLTDGVPHSSPRFWRNSPQFRPVHQDGGRHSFVWLCWSSAWAGCCGSVMEYILRTVAGFFFLESLRSSWSSTASLTVLPFPSPPFLRRSMSGCRCMLSTGRLEGQPQLCEQKCCLERGQSRSKAAPQWPPSGEASWSGRSLSDNLDPKLHQAPINSPHGVDELMRSMA